MKKARRKSCFFFFPTGGPINAGGRLQMMSEPEISLGLLKEKSRIELRVRERYGSFSG